MAAAYRRFFKRTTSLLCAAILIAALAAMPVSANSAQRHWRGSDSAGAIVVDEACPIVVEKELLTFDIPQFPDSYYKDVSDFLAYEAKVTAEYTFHNPADYTVTATLLFPFGTAPDYEFLGDQSADVRTAQTEKYNVTVNGEEIPRTLRYSLSEWGWNFVLDRDMALLHDGYREHSFYSPDMLVTRYTYTPSNVDLETYRAANAAFVLDIDSDKTKVLMEGQNGGKTLENGVLLQGWVDHGQFVVNAIGEPLEELPEWTFYENGACENEIDGTMTLTGTETMTLKEFLLSQYDEEIGVRDYDWYNAMIESMLRYEWQYGAISSSEVTFDLSGQLMRWYEYEITLAPGETIVNTVTAPIYPSINGDYEPPVYEYTYLLSPAQSWTEFGTLDIVVNTPYYMISSGAEGFEYRNPGYSMHLGGLPDGELTFVLSESDNPEEVASEGYLLITLAILAAMIIIPVVLVIVLIKLLAMLLKKLP